ncbi:hypothetical protein BDW75DRAFT_250956 [Aspergillus navahoensis]
MKAKIQGVNKTVKNTNIPPPVIAAGDSNMAMFQATKAGLTKEMKLQVSSKKLALMFLSSSVHEMCTTGGSYAEYAISWSHTTFYLPHHITFEEAATIPLAALTAAVSLYAHHRLPSPWTPALNPIPLIIYGASGAVGSYAIKLACNSNVHPIIAATAKGISSCLKQAGHTSVWHAIDAAIVPQSAEVLRRVVAPGGQIDFILPNDFDVAPATKSVTSVGSFHNQPEFENNEELGYVFSRYISRALQNGCLSGHPFEIRPGGLEGVEEALRDLKDGRASAMKYVFRIADTPGVEQDNLFNIIRV